MISRLDYELNSFMAKYISSLIFWELLNYYHQHPDSGYSVDFLADYLNHEPVEVCEAMDVLTDTGEFKLYEDKYYYQPTAEFKKEIEILIKMMDNPETRRLILANILKYNSNQRII